MSNDLRLDEPTREKYKEILKPLLQENVPREYFYLWNLMIDFHVKQNEIRDQMNNLQEQIEMVEHKLFQAKHALSSDLTI